MTSKMTSAFGVMVAAAGGLVALHAYVKQLARKAVKNAKEDAWSLGEDGRKSETYRRVQASANAKGDVVDSKSRKILFDPPLLEEVEAKPFLDFHFERQWTVTVFVIKKTPKEDEEDDRDFVQRIIDEVSRFTSLRYGDFKDVVYISAEGTERSCQMAACAKYTYGELIHDFYHAETLRLEFSIPRNEHLLANIARAIYNVHPWGEAVIKVHETFDFRRFGRDENYSLMVQDVYRVNTSNKTGKMSQTEHDVMKATGQDFDAPYVDQDPMGNLDKVSPQIRKMNWDEAYMPELGQLETTTRRGSDMTFLSQPARTSRRFSANTF